jgi:hypothetical protein
MALSVQDDSISHIVSYYMSYGVIRFQTRYLLDSGDLGGSNNSGVAFGDAAHWQSLAKKLF